MQLVFVGSLPINDSCMLHATRFRPVSVISITVSTSFENPEGKIRQVAGTPTMCNAQLRANPASARKGAREPGDGGGRVVSTRSVDVRNSWCIHYPLSVGRPRWVSKIRLNPRLNRRRASLMRQQTICDTSYSKPFTKKNKKNGVGWGWRRVGENSGLLLRVSNRDQLYPWTRRRGRVQGGLQAIKPATSRRVEVRFNDQKPHLLHPPSRCNALDTQRSDVRLGPNN